MLDKGKASLLFSASFTPLDYYQEVLGGGEKALRYRLPSPFDPANQKNPDRKLHPDDLPATDSQSASDRRCPFIEWIHAKSGNYMVFFPSYQYLDEVAEAFITRIRLLRCSYRIQL